MSENKPKQVDARRPGAPHVVVVEDAPPRRGKPIPPPERVALVRRPAAATP